MGKKSRAKQSGKSSNFLIKSKKELLKMASDLFKLGVIQPSRHEEWDYYLKLYKAVEEFNVRHKAVLGNISNITDRASALPDFLSWLEKKGVFYDHIALQQLEGEHGYGFVATEAIEVKTSLASIPRKVMLSYEDAAKSYLRDLILGNEVLSVMPNVCLALYLHCEKHAEDSPYKPYIDIFPNEFNTILYFTPDEMKFLTGSTALSTAISQYRSIVRQFAMLYQVFNGSHQSQDVEMIPLSARDAFTFDAYRWCVSAVTTRQNKIPTKCDMENHCEGVHPTLALIPFWDMFNHSSGPLSTTFNINKDAIECFAMTEFKAGEEVTICYGGRPNCELLIHNGFVVDDNPYDKVYIWLGISSQDPLYSKRTAMLKRFSQEPNSKYAVCAMDGNLPTSPNMLSFLRVFHMNEDELDLWMDKPLKQLSCFREVFISLPKVFKGDVKMWEYLENRVNLLIRGMDRSFESGIDTLLQNENLSTRAKLALRLRKEEHKVLSTCAKFCQQFRLSMVSEKMENVMIKDAEGAEDGDDSSPPPRSKSNKLLDDILAGKSIHDIARSRELESGDSTEKHVTNKSEESVEIPVTDDHLLNSRAEIGDGELAANN